MNAVGTNGTKFYYWNRRRKVVNRIDFNHAKVMPMILDVGCGCNPRGDVNINIDRSVPKQKLMPNFILADAQYLPLRDKCFSLVYASHVIEHVQDPL